MNFPLRYLVLIFVFQNTNVFAGRENKEDSLLQLVSVSNDTSKVLLLDQLAENSYESDFDKGIKYAEQALSVAKRIGFLKGEAITDHKTGLIYYYKGDFEKALRYYIASRTLYERTQNKIGIAEIDLQIGNFYKKQDDTKNAMEHFRKAMTVFSELGIAGGIANCYNNFGLINEAEHKVDSAIFFYNKALNEYSIANDSTGMSYSLDYLSGALMLKKKYDESLKYELRALSLRQRLKLDNPVAISFNNIGEIFLAKGDYKNAADNFEKSIVRSRAIGYLDLSQYSCEQAANCYSKLGDHQKAYEYLSLATRIKDSIYTVTRSRQVTEMQAKYETDKKQKENEILGQQNKIKDLELESKQRTIYITLAIVALFISVIFLVYYNYRARQREILNTEMLRQEQLRTKAIIVTQENERKRIAEELHDGIGQMLSVVKMNVSALEDNLKEKNSQFTNAIDLIDESCRELRTISHNMMPGILIKAGLVPAIKEFTEKINSSGTIHIQAESEITNERFNDIYEVNLFRIIQELVSNIIKYANATEVQLTISKEKNILTVMLEDNGKGFDKTILRTSSGNGWNNINSRINLLNGKIEIDSQIGKGTVIFIEVPIA